MADAGKLIANNKKAYHDYFIEEKYEAGHGHFTARRSSPCVWENAASRKSFIRIENGEVHDLRHAHQPVRKGEHFQQGSAACERSCCLHKQEINGRLLGKQSRRRAIRWCRCSVYFKGRPCQEWRSDWPVVKKLYDKRQDIAKKDQRREAEKELKVRNPY